MPIRFPHATVLTGGPCCGKTTLLDMLKALGYRILPEMARAIIAESQANGSDLLPWVRLLDFQKEVARRTLEQEEILEHYRGPVFLDRGLVDGAGYCVEGGIEVIEEIVEHGPYRYGNIFVLEALPASCYKKDENRVEEPERAALIHQHIYDAYKRFGYDPISLPAVHQHDRIIQLLRMCNL